MTTDRPTDAEIVTSFLHVFTVPLARAIVAEMKGQGLTATPAAVDVVGGLQEKIDLLEDELMAVCMTRNAALANLKSAQLEIQELHLELSRLRARQAVEVDTEPDDDDDDIAAAFDAAHDFEDADVPLSVKPKKACQNCLRWIKGKCGSKSGPHAHTSTGAGCTCDWHVERPPSPPAKPVDGRRLPRGLCHVCYREYPVTGQGIYPHDIHGMEYRAGRGDYGNPCVGSRHPPAGKEIAQ